MTFSVNLGRIGRFAVGALRASGFEPEELLALRIHAEEDRCEEGCNRVGHHDALRVLARLPRTASPARIVEGA